VFTGKRVFVLFLLAVAVGGLSYLGFGSYRQVTATPITPNEIDLSAVERQLNLSLRELVNDSPEKAMARLGTYEGDHFKPLYTAKAFMSGQTDGNNCQLLEVHFGQGEFDGASLPQQNQQCIDGVDIDHYDLVKLLAATAATTFNTYEIVVTWSSADMDPWKLIARYEGVNHDGLRVVRIHLTMYGWLTETVAYVTDGGTDVTLKDDV
jgi:hypothetical protein